MRLPVLTLLCLILFSYLVKHRWTEGQQVMESVGVWFRSLPVVSAFEQAALELREGETVMEVFSGFVRLLGS